MHINADIAAIDLTGKSFFLVDAARAISACMASGIIIAGLLIRAFKASDDRSSRAWLHGKLLIALLAQKLVRIGRDISPFRLLILGGGDHVVRRVNSVSRFTRSSKLSNRTSPCGKRSIRGIRLHKPGRKSHVSDCFNWQNGAPREHRSKTDPPASQ
jgi:hypothetical protein